MPYNKSFINNDTSDQVNKYLDEICSDPAFLCSNKDLCGKNTSIYSSVENVNDICNDLSKANECENDFQECVVQVLSSFDETPRFISTSFSNIIIPIPNALDQYGNTKFIRLPALSSSKKPKSMETCSICACMNRFATSPGGGLNEYTSPGQNQCVYVEFEYYYYPVSIQNVNKTLKDMPLMIGKYTVLNSNIIPILTEEDLSAVNMYKVLTRNKIPEAIALSFIKNILYKGNESAIKDLRLFLINKSV
jgi:hypothetical protein